jgi:hypothetical protein
MVTAAAAVVVVVVVAAAAALVVVVVVVGKVKLSIPQCLDNRLTDGGKVVSAAHSLHFTHQKHYYLYVSDTHFC